MQSARSAGHYGKDSTVYLVTAENKFASLDLAMQRAGFIDNVESVFQKSGVAREEFLIAIKPNIMTGSSHENPSPVYTDPELVEFMVGRLRDCGYRNIAVVEAQNVYNYSYRDRTVGAVAALAGYTQDGYRIEDLSEQKEPFDYGGVLGHHSVGRTWRDAHYRISFAKNKTHWQAYYTGCLKNVYGCLPEWDKMKHYHGKNVEFYQCCILIADAFPVHFGFLDAWVSGDGLSGHVRDADPNETHTIFASDNIFALDWVQGEKMNVDPQANPVIQEALRFWGPIKIVRAGYMAPWQPWTNIQPWVIKALDVVEEWYGVSRFLSRAFASDQDARFRPVSQSQWLFDHFHWLVRSVERFGLKTYAPPLLPSFETTRAITTPAADTAGPPVALVTGANGFIGSHLVPKLLEQGYRVRGLVRSTSDLSSLAGQPIELFIGDVSDPASLVAPLTDVDYVFHLAGALLVSSQPAFEEANVQGTRNVLAAAESYAGPRLKRFVFTSSLAGCGPSPDGTPLTESIEMHPVSWYGQSKRKAEGIVRQYGERLPVTIVRPAPVYGERERDISRTFDLIRSGIQPRLGTTETRTVMVYVEDLVEGIVCAAESEAATGKTYFMNHPEVLTSTQVVQTIAAAMDRPKGITLPVPLAVLRIAAPIGEFVSQFTRSRPPTTRDKLRELAQSNWTADPSAAQRDLGWQAGHNLMQGMVPTTRDYFARQEAERAMAKESQPWLWIKYLTIAVLLGLFIEISAATGKFYRFEPGWLVLVIIFGAFGLTLGSLSMLTRRWSALAQFALGSAAAGAVELLNALNLTTSVRWIFSPGWPLGIQNDIVRALVLGLAGGVFILVVNAILRSLYQHRLRAG